jgi:hypothetical protein
LATSHDQMPSVLSTIRRLDAARPVALPLVANPPVDELMVAPYWVEGCHSDEHETSLSGAAGLIAAAWCQTGGRRQHQCVVGLLQAGGMSCAAALELADRARQTVGEGQGHAEVVQQLCQALVEGIVAG